MTISRVLLASALLLAAAPAAAADFSFAGTFDQDDDFALFDFVVGAPSTVTLRTYSWAGGVNAAGATIASGGFDPVLSIYDGAGNAVAFADDGGAAVPTDPVAGSARDSFFQRSLGTGTYTAALTQYSNIGGATLSATFSLAGQPSFTGDICRQPGDQFLAATSRRCIQRSNAWALDILDVQSAIGPGVPEPATWALMVAGFGLIGRTLRRRAGRGPVVTA